MADPASASYQIAPMIEAAFPALRPAQQRGLALWVMGVVAAKRCGEAAVLLALLPLGLGRRHALRAQLREWLCDGAERAAPCRTRLDVTGCFAPLLGWVLRWWQGEGMALAVDATSLRERVVVVAISVLYRGSAIPVAWIVRPGSGDDAGRWMPELVALLGRLAAVVPATLPVLVLTDRGLWSPALWGQIRALGWHPLMRVRPDATFRPAGHPRVPARSLVPGPGHAWVGAGVAYKHAPKRVPATLLVVWAVDEAEPWILLTDLAPQDVGLGWYGLRVWVELGFRALKSFGWDWERTRRTDLDRIARHWLVLAVATLLTLAYGTRDEDAEWAGVPPANLRRARPTRPPRTTPRRDSVFARGLAWLNQHVIRRRLWTCLWLLPEPWPDPPPGLHLTLIPIVSATAHPAYLPL